MSSKSKISYEDKTIYKKPKMYNIIIYNDDYTTMEFVVELLVNIFHKTSVAAVEIMMKIHETGKDIIGTYTYDIAVTKKITAENLARKNNFPLKITIEEAVE